MEILNKKRAADAEYVAGFMSKRVGIYAPSLAAAKQKAMEHYKPKKKDMGLLWVELSTNEKNQAVHVSVS